MVSEIINAKAKSPEIMSDEVKKDIVENIDNFLKRIKSNDFSDLSEISNHTIHDASIYQDKDSVFFAVAIYSISKLKEKTNFDLSKFEHIFLSMKHSLMNDNYESYRKSVSALLKIIDTVDRKLHLYVENILDQAKIKKGSKIYDHGISIAQASEISGIALWDLIGYVGNTNIYENSISRIKYKEKFDAVSRLKFLLSKFK